jgi:hypothetical protein
VLKTIFCSACVTQCFTLLTQRGLQILWISACDVHQNNKEDRSARRRRYRTSRHCIIAAAAETTHGCKCLNKKHHAEIFPPLSHTAILSPLLLLLSFFFVFFFLHMNKKDSFFVPLRSAQYP